MRKSELIQVEKGNHKLTLVEVVKEDMSIKEVTESMILDGN